MLAVEKYPWDHLDSPKCPFCGKTSQCEEHYAGDIIYRAKYFAEIIYAITKVKIEFYDGENCSTTNYGIRWSGNLEYSKDPIGSLNASMKYILNCFMLSRKNHRIKKFFSSLRHKKHKALETEESEKIITLYKMILSGKPFEYSVTEDSREVVWHFSDEKKVT